MGNFIQKRIDELKSDITTAAQKYYTDGTSEVSDAEFDAMVDELKQLDPAAPEVNQTGWGYDVNLDTTPGQKKKHRYGPVKGLEKVHNWKEFSRQLKWDPQYVASLKLDGLSVVLYYKEGELLEALTRGDGDVGIDITPKVLAIDPAFGRIHDRWTGAVRGEIVMSYDNFTQFQKKYPDAKNARNSAAGIIGSNEVTDKLQWLDIVVYSIVGAEDEGKIVNCLKMADIVEFLRTNFNAVAPFAVVDLREENFLSAMETLRGDWYNEYPADGIVLTAVDTNADFWTGSVTYHSAAFKFASEVMETTVVNVEWNMSKHGVAVPRVEVEPVELAGTTVKACTGYNAKYINDNGVGPGSRVEITKCGEIIPNIVRVLIPTSAQLPMACPECGEPLEWSGVTLVCKNPECGNARRQDISIWLENLAPVEGLKDALRFKYLDEIFGDSATVDFIMENPEVVFDSKLMADAAAGGGHAQLVYEMFNKLYNGKFELVDAIRACNIPRFGEITSAKLASHSDLVKTLLQVEAAEAYALVGSVLGVADTEQLVKHLNKLKRLSLIEERINWEAVPAAEAVKVAITGKLSVKRADFEKELKAGGYIAGEINKETKFLITDDPNSNSSKNVKADAWGITKITESEFRSKYLGGSR